MHTQNMAKIHVLAAYFVVLMKLINQTTSLDLPDELLSLDIATRLCLDTNCTKIASSDYGKLVQQTPSAVLYPSSVSDISELVKFSYRASVPFTVAARGHGHSVRGQAMARKGVVVEMTNLNKYRGINGNIGIRVSWNPSLGFYVDVGGEQLWIDVLQTTLEHGLAPLSWTDYLYLTVGGTLSNAGVSGQSFLHGPQISNVHEMDVINGKGEFITCSKSMNSDLFYAVLGGLGQFGIITRARIALEKAPNRVKWVRMLYDNFSDFTKDQEHLISIDHRGLDYLEGALITQKSPPNNWRSSTFYSALDQSKINSLLPKHGVIYSLEAVKYYDDLTADTVDEELQELLKGMNFIPGFIFKKDATIVDFLNRVKNEELKLQSKGLWDVPHPWLNMFVPKSRIMDFNQGVFIDIIYKQNMSSGPFLVYPIYRKMWDDQTSAVIPEEEVFYSIALLQSAVDDDDSRSIDEQNEEILRFCDNFGIEMKQYLPHYKTMEAWKKHFGAKWEMFKESKAKFDPKMILSPGQRIFI